jgi:hypothetical protein
MPAINDAATKWVVENSRLIVRPRQASCRLKKTQAGNISDLLPFICF